MNDERPLIEKVLELTVYAPVGVALHLRAGLDTFVASGRRRVSERVQVARWVGEMAVTYGLRDVEKRLAGAKAPAVGPAPVVVARASPVAQPMSPPFDDYQHLAATQVVQLLGRLPSDELRAIREYEVGHRGRRTILAKLDQLLGVG